MTNIKENPCVFDVGRDGVLPNAMTNIKENPWSGLTTFAALIMWLSVCKHPTSPPKKIIKTGWFDGYYCYFCSMSVRL